jgi:hypothetical protein
MNFADREHIALKSNGRLAFAKIRLAAVQAEPAFIPNWYETLPDNSVTRGFDKELFKNSVEIPGEHIEAVAAACKRGRISAVVGVNERLAAAGRLSFPRQKHLQPRP